MDEFHQPPPEEPIEFEPPNIKSPNLLDLVDPEYEEGPPWKFPRDPDEEKLWDQITDIIKNDLSVTTDRTFRSYNAEINQATYAEIN